MKIKILLIAIFFGIAGMSSAFAQNVVPVASANLSSTIATTNTFQSVQSQNNGRIGCTLQNNGVSGNSMWVYFGSCASATKAASVVLATGQSAYCGTRTSPYVLRDQVCITGTSGDAFFANFQ